MSCCLYFQKTKLFSTSLIMDNESHRVVQGTLFIPLNYWIETPNVNSQEGTPSVRQSPFVSSPSIQTGIQYNRSELENSIPTSLYTLWFWISLYRLGTPRLSQSQDGSPISEVWVAFEFKVVVIFPIWKCTDWYKYRCNRSNISFQAISLWFQSRRNRRWYGSGRNGNIYTEDYTTNQR